METSKRLKQPRIAQQFGLILRWLINMLASLKPRSQSVLWTLLKREPISIMATSTSTSSRAFNDRLKAHLDSIPADTLRMVALSFAISDRIAALMIKRRVSRADLAKAMGKQKSEITTWLSGQQNFTLKTIAKIEEFFGENIIELTPFTSPERGLLINYGTPRFDEPMLLLAEPEPTPRPRGERKKPNDQAEPTS